MSDKTWHIGVSRNIKLRHRWFRMTPFMMLAHAQWIDLKTAQIILMIILECLGHNILTTLSMVKRLFGGKAIIPLTTLKEHGTTGLIITKASSKEFKISISPLPLYLVPMVPISTTSNKAKWELATYWQVYHPSQSFQIWSQTHLSSEMNWMTMEYMVLDYLSGESLGSSL